MSAFDRESVLEYHRGGKVAVRLPRPLKTKEDLCLAYTPGVAHAVREIAKTPSSVYDVTAKENLVAVVSDGTAILGLGDLGAAASIPVMEGKAVLFKAFGDVDAWPVPLDCCREGGGSTGRTDPERVIAAVKAIAPQYGGINLEDIASPACFEIEDRLDAELDIPVFHDDQWGTAVISLAGVMNYAKLAGKSMGDLRIVMNGAGAAGIRICEMLKAAGACNVTMCDRKGTIRRDRQDLNEFKARHAVDTKAQTLKEALVGADVFIGFPGRLRDGEPRSRDSAGGGRRGSLRPQIRDGDGPLRLPQPDQQRPWVPVSFQGRSRRPGDYYKQRDEGRRGECACGACADWRHRRGEGDLSRRDA